MPERVEYLTINEIQTLLKAIDDDRDRAIITLFLNTGIFLNELTSLKVNNVIWEKKAIVIGGNRKREIILNDQAYEALARWSKERPDTRTAALFTTTKGKPKDLSARMIDHLLRNYAERAGIRRKVNAQILRNTFAIRLFIEESSTEKIATILGITDPESINRYQRAAKLPPPQPEMPAAETLEKLDTRPRLSKAISGIFPTKPKIVKPVTHLKGAIIPVPEEMVLGRESVIDETKSSLNKSQSVVFIGPLGIGKTHLLKHMTRILSPNAVYLSSPAPLKNLLGLICYKIDPDWHEQIKTRASTKDIIDYILKIIGPKPPILIIDNLNNLKVTDADTFASLLDNFTILGAVDEINPKLKQIWWKFRRIELCPLSDHSAKELIKYLTQNLSISDYEMLETRVLSLSNRLPLAIVDMIHQLSHQPVVTRDKIREVYHEGGIKYRDWSPFLIVIWGVAMVFRFVALGTHSFEGYIMAGVGIAALMTTIRFLRMVK